MISGVRYFTIVSVDGKGRVLLPKQVREYIQVASGSPIGLTQTRDGRVILEVVDYGVGEKRR